MRFTREAAGQPAMPAVLKLNDSVQEAFDPAQRSANNLLPQTQLAEAGQQAGATPLQERRACAERLLLQCFEPKEKNRSYSEVAAGRRRPRNNFDNTDETRRGRPAHRKVR